MAIHQQFFDVYGLRTGDFILRATLPTVSLIYRWRRPAEKRVEDNGTKSTDMYGNGMHEDVRVVPDMSDWQPNEMPV